MLCRRTLASKLKPPVVKPPARDDARHDQRQLRQVVAELIGVPAELRIAAVHVDAAEHVVGERVGDLVLEAVARQGGVVRLDVDLEVLGRQAVALEERVHRRRVVVVLVLRRLIRLRLDEQRALEADLVLVLDDQVHEAPELIELALHVGVEQRLVAFAAAPEHVVLAAQLLRDLEGLLHLRGGVGEHLGIGVGRGARHVARVREQVGRPPQQLDAGALHVACQHVDDPIEDVVGLRQRRALPARRRDRGNRRTGTPSFSKNSKPTAAFSSASSSGSPVAMPGRVERAGAEHVEAVPDEGVPVADRHPQVVLHALAAHDAVLVVVAERPARRARPGPGSGWARFRGMRDCAMGPPFIPSSR